MRVALVTAHYPPRLSGHADYCSLLAHALIDEGLDVSVVVLGQDEVLDGDGLEVTNGCFPGSLGELGKVVDQIHELAPDVVLLQFEAHAFQLAWAPHLLPMMLRRRGMRVVMTYHELWKPGRLGHLPKVAVLNAPHRVVTFSHWHADGVARFRKLGPRADIVACGSNIVKPVTADRSLLRARFDIEASTILFTFFGFVMKEHKVVELIEALAEVRSAGFDARLQVIGKFDPKIDGYHQQLVRRSVELGLREAVTWHGRVMDDTDVARLIQVSDVGVLPYDTGVGENNGAFAAFAHYGVPTVTTRGHRSATMEQMEVARFVEATGDGLADAMLDLARDPETRELLSKRVKEWADRRSWKAAGTAYASILTGDEPTVEVL
ncbi:MAG: glycosyltransferase [Actinomycetia bacterium]|nr:glycosyltransferase [Actinomycetes bacterium]MCP4960985.1 glycosyltransferase [Actinomycetes bacterium]